MDYSAFYHYINRYVDLKEDEWKLLSDHLVKRNYLKGQFIVQQGDVCHYESFVIKGCLKTFHIDKDGNEHIVMFAIENWFTSDLGSFLNKTPADYNVQCIEDTEVIQFTYDQLQDLYVKIPVLERFFRIIIQNAFVASDKRIVRNFSLSAKERYDLFRAQYPEIERRVPQYMIASYLGITKEFLSKIRKPD